MIRMSMYFWFVDNAVCAGGDGGGGGESECVECVGSVDDDHVR